MLGREHSAAQAIRALEAARALFPRISFDLTYARPEQSACGLACELEQALPWWRSSVALPAHHRAGHRYEALHRQGLIVLPERTTAAALYEETAQVARAGLAAYEVSNYARPGAESRHNLAYWRYGDYAGIGPGAHGRVTLDGGLCAPAATARPSPGQSGSNAPDRRGPAAPVDDAERPREMLLMGLRLAKAQRGLSRPAPASLGRCDRPRVLRDAAEETYLELNDDHLAGDRQRAPAPRRAARRAGDLTIGIARSACDTHRHREERLRRS